MDVGLREETPVAEARQTLSEPGTIDLGFEGLLDFDM